MLSNGIETRLVIAYGLIALMVVAAAVLTWWMRHNSHRARIARSQARLAKRYQRQDEAARIAARTDDSASA